MLKNVKIGTKLLAIVAFLVAAPLGLVLYTSITKATGAVVAAADDGLMGRAQGLAGNLTNLVKGNEALAQVLAERVPIVAATEAVDARGASSSAAEIASATALLSSYVHRSGLGYKSAGVGLIGQDGTVFASTSTTAVGKSFASSRFFKQAIAGSRSVGMAVKEKSGSTIYIPVAAPIYNSAGTRVIGVLMDMLDQSYLESIVVNQKIGRTGYAFIIEQPGYTIAHPKRSLVLNLQVAKSSAALLKTLLSPKAATMHYFFQGRELANAHVPVPIAHWAVSVSVPISEFLAQVYQLRDIVLLVTAIALVCALVVLFLFVRSITRPLSDAVEYSKKVASGDFTRRLGGDRKDEIGVLTSTLDNMVDGLQEMILKIREASERTSTSSEEISSSARQLDEAAQNQASTLEETSASVEELASSVEQVADHSRNQATSVVQTSRTVGEMKSSAGQVADTLQSVSSSSGQSTSRARSGMEAIAKVVDSINSISESSQQIAGIVTIISDIADQTNLLALNASIEAARAGEHGRGFAVVADEVSKLADRSSVSTKEIERLIRESSRNVQAGVEIAQLAKEAMQGIIDGADVTNEMISTLVDDMKLQIESIEEVAGVTESINEMSQSISAATEEQTTNARQVSKAIENVNELTQQAAGAAEEMSAATEELSGLSEQLRTLVEQFSVSQDAAQRIDNPEESPTRPESLSSADDDSTAVDGDEPDPAVMEDLIVELERNELSRRSRNGDAGR